MTEVPHACKQSKIYRIVLQKCLKFEQTDCRKGGGVRHVIGNVTGLKLGYLSNIFKRCADDGNATN
jgi:hypothetical protein